MGSSIEYQLIGKIIETQDFHTVEKLKIDDSFFLSDAQTKEIFKFVKDHYHNEHTYGSVPSWQILQQRFHGFPFVDSQDTLPTLCQELRRSKMRADILTMAENVMATVNSDPAAAMDIMKTAITEMSSAHEISRDMLLSSAYEKLQSDYNQLAEAAGITGIPYPWDILNDDTQGMHPGNLVIIYGRPKSMKTFVALYICTYAYMKNMRVLIWSMEMSEMQVLRRVAAMIANVDYDKFKKAKLDPGARDKVWEILMTIKDEEKAKGAHFGHTPAILAANPGLDNSGISSLQAKIREFKPDLVLVDGLYLMKDDRSKNNAVDWKSISHISRDLKRTASQFQIPIIGVTQANRSADKDPKKSDLMELAYADALAQDCDLCMRISKQKDQTTHEPELVISIPGGRETQLEGFVINGIPCTNFNFKRPTITDHNIQQEQKQNSQPAKKTNNGPTILPNWGRH